MCSRLQCFEPLRSALLMAVDRQRSGSLTLGEFTAYIQTLREVTLTANISEEPDTKDISDSFFTFLRDLRYAGYLLKRRFTRALTPLEEAILKRTTKDVFSLVPYLLIFRSSLTPVLKLLLTIMLWKNIPNLSPSASTRPRRRFARTWASIARKQRERAMQAWSEGAAACFGPRESRERAKV